MASLFVFKVAMLWDGALYLLGSLTPKFYVALTGISALTSGFVLIFEWWYYRKYGTSFIEQLSFERIVQWFATGELEVPAEAPDQCNVYCNPLSLLRGAEYARFYSASRTAPLTYYDMNLTSQEHQAWFGVSEESEGAGAAERCMSRAWRECSAAARVAAAREALEHAPRHAPALLLLGEEHARTVLEAETSVMHAWRAAEAALRNGVNSTQRARLSAVLAHCKLRAAAIWRRRGELRGAARLLRELCRDAPPALARSDPHENLIELLLEQRAYSLVQAVLSKLEDSGVPPTATTLYTQALLKARIAAIQPNSASAEQAAKDAMLAALSYNPWVSELVLEQRCVRPPPEHVCRGGRSEARAYSAAHLPHWRREPHARAVLSQCAAQLPRAPTPPRTDAALLSEPRAACRAPCQAIVLCLAGVLLAMVAVKWPEAEPRPGTAALLHA